MSNWIIVLVIIVVIALLLKPTVKENLTPETGLYDVFDSISDILYSKKNHLKDLTLLNCLNKDDYNICRKLREAKEHETPNIEIINNPSLHYPLKTLTDIKMGDEIIVKPYDFRIK